VRDEMLWKLEALKVKSEKRKMKKDQGEG